MWREFVNARLARSIFHDFPQNLRRHAVSPDRPGARSGTELLESVCENDKDSGHLVGGNGFRMSAEDLTK